MGAADWLIVAGVISIPIIAYATNIGGFATWINSAGQGAAAQPGPAVPSFPRGTGRTPITSTLCKCGSGRAVHVYGDCNSCKATCAGTCGNCSPQCLGTKTSVPSSGFAQSFATYPMKGLIVS